MPNKFKTWMLATYDRDTLLTISEHGCASCAPSAMIYYDETTELFLQYRDELFEIMSEYQQNAGDFENLPAYVRTNSETFTSFANAVVWFCAELVAWENANEEENNDDADE